MARRIVQRLLLAIPVLLAVLTIVFFVVRVIPGDPAIALLGDNASAQAVASLRENMGLNEPLPAQYIQFLGGLLRGNLGRSMITGIDIRDQVLSVLPYSLQLAFLSIVIGLLCGVPIGIWTAVNRNRLPDYVGRVLSLAGLSVPAFYLAILLMLVFAIWLRVLPAVGGGRQADLKDLVLHLILPALTLGLIMTASVARLVRSAMLDTLGQDYIRTARAKGLREATILVRHAFRSALVPVTALIGIWAVSIIGDSVTVEMVFARPGLGKMLVGAILQRDYTAVQSIMVVYATIIVGINLMVDLVYGFVDPRVRE